MERSELMSSAASGSDELTQTENDDTLSEACSEDTLNLVEGAILRTLRKYSSQPNSHDAKAVVETRLRGGFRNARGEDQQSAVSGNAPAARSSNPEDRALLANLLEQVKDLRRNQTPSSRRRREALSSEVLSTPKPARGASFDRRRGRERRSSSTYEELRMTLEAAAMAAKAAADAAEAAAVSVARNTEAIEFIVKSMQASPKKRRKSKRGSSGEKIASQNAIVRSNSITHWILGLTVISTIAWRFGVVKVAKRITSKLNDPLGYVGGLIGSGDEPSKDHKKKPGEDPAEKANLLEKFQQLEMPQLEMPQLEIPSILSNDSEESPNGKETSDPPPKSAAAAGAKSKSKPKDVEKTVFSFGNLLQIRPSKS